MSWQPLTKLHPRHGELPDYEFRFPDDAPYRPDHWRDIMVIVSAWLWDEGYFRPRDCPISRPLATKRHLVNTEPVHSDGSRFSNPDTIREVYLETKDNNDRLVENARIIIDHVAPGLVSEFTFRRVR